MFVFLLHLCKPYLINLNWNNIHKYSKYLSRKIEYKNAGHGEGAPLAPLIYAMPLYL